MRVKSIATLAFTATMIFQSLLIPADSQQVVAQNAPAGVQRFAWRPSGDEVPAPTTVLRASTGTGISAAHIDRTTPDQIRVAALPQTRVARATSTVNRLRSKLSEVDVPAAPEMKRRGFLVGFRKPQQSTDATSVVAPESAESVVSIAEPQTSQSQLFESTPQPRIPSADDYTITRPAPPETQTGDHEFTGSSLEPQLTIPGNAGPETNYCGRNCKKSRCNLGCEKKLFPSYCSGLEIGGWISQGYHNRETIMTNNRRDELNLHQAWLYFDKAASQDSCDWDFGYRADVLYGIDAQDLQAYGNGPTGAPSGWDNDWDNGSYGWALPQLYAEFANYDWNVKVGKFFSPFGYEVIGAPDNFFYSHTYTMYNSEPFTMSGVLAEKRVSDSKSYVMGATAGWDTGFESNEGGGNIIFGSRNQINEDINLAVTNSWGDAGTRGNGGLTSAVAQVQLTDSISYVFQGDVLNLDDNNEFGIVNYLFKEVNPCLSLGARLEWWKSDQFFADTKSTWGYTVGANIRRSANLVIRPELRFDWGAAALDPGTPILGIDAIMTF